jgi:hypothetical protein
MARHKLHPWMAVPGAPPAATSHAAAGTTGTGCHQRCRPRPGSHICEGCHMPPRKKRTLAAAGPLIFPPPSRRRQVQSPGDDSRSLVNRGQSWTSYSSSGPCSGGSTTRPARTLVKIRARCARRSLQTNNKCLRARRGAGTAASAAGPARTPFACTICAGFWQSHHDPAAHISPFCCGLWTGDHAESRALPQVVQTCTLGCAVAAVGQMEHTTDNHPQAPGACSVCD